MRQDAPIPLDVSFACGPDDVLAIYGPSGSGKTTLLRCIAGLHTPRQGRIVCHGETWTDTGADGGGRVSVPTHERRVGLVFQDYALFPHLTRARERDGGAGRSAGRRTAVSGGSVAVAGAPAGTRIAQAGGAVWRTASARGARAGARARSARGAARRAVRGGRSRRAPAAARRAGRIAAARPRAGRARHARFPRCRAACHSPAAARSRQGARLRPDRGDDEPHRSAVDPGRLVRTQPRSTPEASSTPTSTASTTTAASRR